MTKYNPNIHHRRSIRLQGYDYAQEGLYFITLCVQNRECLFGDIKDGIMTLSDIGKVVQAEWLNTLKVRTNVALHSFVVMPNHFHAIIEIVYRRGECNSPPHQLTFKSPSQTVGAMVRGFKSAVSRQLGFSVWQRDYYEHIIRDERAYDNISNYINDNPLKWDSDKFILPTQKL